MSEKLPTKLEIDFDQYNHIKVLNNRVMVKQVDIDYTKTSSGILLAPVAEGNQRFSFTQGIVVRVGEGALLPDGTVTEITPEVGDVIYFSDAAGVDFKVLRRDEEGNLDFEEVRIVDCGSIYYVDGSVKDEFYSKVENLD